jgi:hypothetical protein
LDSELAYFSENQASGKPGDPLGESVFQIRRSGYERPLRAYMGRYTLPPTNTGHCIPFIQDWEAPLQCEHLLPAVQP